MTPAEIKRAEVLEKLEALDIRTRNLEEKGLLFGTSFIPSDSEPDEEFVS